MPRTKKPDLDHIAEQLRPLAVDVDELVEDPANARLHPTRNMQAITASLRRFGQRKPLVVRSEGRIVEAGNGTLAAARSLGWSHVAAVIVDDDATTATGFAIADNRAGELATWDDAALSALLQEWPEEELPIIDLGFNDDELDALLVLPDEAGELVGGADVFTEDEVKAAAWAFFRDHGVQHRELAAFEVMSQINALARNVGNASSFVAVADWKQAHRYDAEVEGKIKLASGLEKRDVVEKAVGISIGDGVKVTRWGAQSRAGMIKNVQVAKNFWPAVARDIYRRFGGGRVLDTSTGYGGRLVGALASGCVSHYVGIDPNAETCEGNAELLRELGKESFATIINAPAEIVNASAVGVVDMAFTSPPYFTKEHYSDEETQSWKRYGESFEAWCNGFLQPMMALTFECLKSGGTAVVNVEDVTIKSKTHPLVEATEEAGTRAGFELLESSTIPMPRNASWIEKAPDESLLVFRKQ